MRKGQQISEFFYRADGKPYAALYSGDGGTTQAIYYYLLNLQGDIVGMTNASGTVIVRYTYDPWGKVTSVTNSSGAAITSATHFANVNPLRYRGYVYDTETQLYYLQSRYYDPDTGRFLNADAALATGTGVLGVNSFAYCNNLLTISIDSTGNKPQLIEDLEEYRFVGIGIQLDASAGSYECGIEIIVYWDEVLCPDGEPTIVAYTYEGASINLDELLINSHVAETIASVTTAIVTVDETELTPKAIFVMLQGLLTNDFGLSVSVLAVFGKKGEFTKPEHYTGRFDTYSVTAKHIKASYSWSSNCFTIAVGATTSSGFHISFGSTNYSMIK